MASRTVRLLPDLHADGPTQMATDEAMLELVRDGVPALRFYTWDVATLSLGYFQRADDRLVNPKLADLPFVRRSTGGGAIIHHHELTYSFALPPDEPWQPRGTAWTCRFHYLLIEAFATLGITLRACPCEEEQGEGSFLCFQHHTAGDLLIGSEKVVGSAQRRPRGAMLQHGSILLRRSEHAPELPGIADLSGSDVELAALKRSLLAVLTSKEGWVFSSVDWPSQMTPTVRKLLDEKFASDEWNQKR